MMRKITQLFTLLFLITACNGIQLSEKLSQIDSLVVREQYDSATIMLEDAAKESMTEEERAHYYLLTTQLGYIANQPPSSDSLLDLAIMYYNKVKNNQKLADAYIYKSYRSRIDQDFPQAIIYGKKAEQLAMNTSDIPLQFKVAENLSILNSLSENNLLQLQYAKKALAMARKMQNKNWIAYSYNNISFVFANLDQYDSARFYIEKSIPYINYVEDADKIIFLTNIGLLYKDDDTKKAKEYFERALSYGEHPGTIEHLADVYYAEGNKEEAYRLWKKALTIEGRFEKDDLIHSILSYDLEHGNLEEASRNLDEIISIKDSMLYLLRNDTIKDLQLRFDHEMAMHEADKKLISTQRILMALAFFVGVLVFYIYYRRKKEETLEKEHQMQLYAYTTEINELKTNKEKALAEIKDLQSNNEKDSLRINELEENAQNAEAAIEKLNKEIKKLLDDKSPKLKHGRILYDRIMDGEHAGKWSSEEQDLFNYYYAATNYHRWNRLRRVKRAKETNPHNMFYLILKDMGMSDEEVKRIMVLSQEGLRSMRNRTKPIE